MSVFGDNSNKIMDVFTMLTDSLCQVVDDSKDLKHTYDKANFWFWLYPLVISVAISLVLEPSSEFIQIFTFSVSIIFGFSINIMYLLHSSSLDFTEEELKDSNRPAHFKESLINVLKSARNMAHYIVLVGIITVSYSVLFILFLPTQYYEGSVLIESLITLQIFNISFLFSAVSYLLTVILLYLFIHFLSCAFHLSLLSNALFKNQFDRKIDED